MQAQILELMRELMREFGTSLLLITHDMGVVAEMADRVAIMQAGGSSRPATSSQIFERRGRTTRPAARGGAAPGRDGRNRRAAAGHAAGTTQQADAPPVLTVRRLEVAYRGSTKLAGPGTAWCAPWSRRLVRDSVRARRLGWSARAARASPRPARRVLGLIPFSGDVVVNGRRDRRR